MRQQAGYNLVWKKKAFSVFQGKEDDNIDYGWVSFTVCTGTENYLQNKYFTIQGGRGSS